MPSGSIEIENKKKEIKFKGNVTAPEMKFILECIYYIKVLDWMQM